VRVIVLLLAGAAALGATSCDEEDEFTGSPDPAKERSDHPAKPPPGWHTVANRRAGFTLSVPRGWPTRTRRGATLVRSSGRLVAVTVAADRSEDGRTTRPREYARRTFRALPGFRKLRSAPARRVRGSPYQSARVDGRGTLAKRRQRQRITVAAYQRPRRVTYTIVAFSARVGGVPVYAGPLRKILASLRAQRPRV
jgi:hypothetical protein